MATDAQRRLRSSRPQGVTVALNSEDPEAARTGLRPRGVASRAVVAVQNADTRLIAMGMGAAETSVVAEAEQLTQIRAIVDGATSSSDDPAHLTTFLCAVVKMALKALAEAQESGDAEDMDEDTVETLTSWVGGGEEGDGEEGDGEEGDGEEGGSKGSKRRGRKRRRRASAHHKGASAAAPSGTSNEADKAAREARLANRAANRKSALATSAAGGGGGGGGGGEGGGGDEASSSAVAEQSAQRGALIAAIEKVRRGARNSRLEGGESTDLLPRDLLPTQPGVQLKIVDVFQQLCDVGGLPHRVLQFVDGKLQREGEDSPLRVDDEPAAGELVLVKAGAKVLADRFASGWGNFDASAVSLAPRAVVQFLSAVGTPHFVVFTERPHYVSEASNTNGNRCATHCALMGIGVTDTWLKISPFTESARSARRTPITRYDDFPPDGEQGKRSMTRDEFAAELAKLGDDSWAEAYVICDTVQQGPKSVDELLRSIADADFGVSEDSACAVPAMKAFNEEVKNRGGDDGVPHRRGQELPNGFYILKVR